MLFDILALLGFAAGRSRQRSPNVGLCREGDIPVRAVPEVGLDMCFQITQGEESLLTKRTKSTTVPFGAHNHMTTDLPSASPALTTAHEGSVVQMISSVREYTILPPQYLAAVVSTVLVDRNFAVEFSVYFVEEGLKAVVYSLAVKMSGILQLLPADCESPQLRI